MNTATATRLANAATGRLIHTLKEWDEIAAKRCLTEDQAAVVATIKAELPHLAAAYIEWARQVVAEAA